ncbi:MAG TPA: cyclophane-forming radical SAM peptide maturase AmcB [Streptosporangiaceae bacterium]
MTAVDEAVRAHIGTQTGLVVVQPGTLCNLDCAYCYLPARKTRNLMSLDTAAALAASLDGLPAPVTVNWHGGEPLAVPLAHFTALLDVLEPLRASGKIRHSVQTNATLITDAWCDLLKRYDIEPGVSIDGDATATANRRDWAHQPAHAAILRGIATLTAHDIPFGIIAVASPQTMSDPAALMAFLTSLNPTGIAFNIEEREGINTSRPLVDTADAVAFWAGVLASLHHHQISVRELAGVATYAAAIRAGKPWHPPQRSPIPTVAWNGDVVLMSPELNGLTAPRYQDFRAGNIHHQPLATIIANAGQLSYVREYAAGLARCAQECSFYPYCRGGNASNRHAEHGRFDTTETAHCRNTIQAPVTATLNAIRKDRHMAETTQPTPTVTQPTPTEDILARLASDVGREEWHQETFRDFADGRRNTSSGR